MKTRKKVVAGTSTPHIEVIDTINRKILSKERDGSFLYTYLNNKANLKTLWTPFQRILPIQLHSHNNINQCFGSGSGQMMRVFADPDPHRGSIKPKIKNFHFMEH